MCEPCDLISKNEKDILQPPSVNVGNRFGDAMNPFRMVNEVIRHKPTRNPSRFYGERGV